MVRTYWDSMEEMQRLVFTYHLFYPLSKTTNRLILVLDDESPMDHIVGTLYQAAWGKNARVDVKYEPPPPPGTCRAFQRPEGYSRQMWSNFYGDLYSSAQFVGITDSDSEVFREPDPSDVYDERGRPIIHCVGMHSVHEQAAEFLVGKPSPCEAMKRLPFMVKNEHLGLMRQHIAETTGSESFDQAWSKMHDKFGGSFGQFTTMATYLWHYHREDYDWRMTLMDSSKWDPIQDAEVYRNYTQKPCRYAWKHMHLERSSKQAKLLFQQLCYTTNYTTAGCEPYNPFVEPSDQNLELARLGAYFEYSDYLVGALLTPEERIYANDVKENNAEYVATHPL